ncbi:MAG: hypothetical protein ACW7DW_05675 [Paraglaciecola chathamensis]|uniref:Sulfite dehydrogenase (Cytochrome) subunit SorB n=1 Tax=Paraglaciecola agarilytica NO2 TaxID=1125747 RepID=A0ABQ0IDQ3_9ALTE|nr:hypothetical protein [Paraglaciecola agarilytica]GAC07367.1 hypothetical protein GAGA_4542 [Paraglaciecola agarilytica NO2]
MLDLKFESLPAKRLLAGLVCFYMTCTLPAWASEPADKAQIDSASGLVIQPGFEMVRAHCTACHSAKLVTQNHMSRERWLSTIRWMQKTQNLWPLPQEDEILDYLSANYGERDMGRRSPLPAHLMPKS